MSARAENQHRLIERFVPESDVAECHEVRVNAPADLVFDVAENFDFMSVPLVYAIFWVRARILGARPPDRQEMNGLVTATRRMGWGELARRPGRELVMGAAVQPWLPEPIFKSVPPESFRDHSEPEHVKIVWTLEAEPLGPARTCFRTETRVQPMDEAARKRFRRYWRLTGFGILLIRRLFLSSLRRTSERRARTL